VRELRFCSETPGGRLRRPAASSGVRREACVGERLRRKFIIHFTNTEKKPRSVPQSRPRGHLRGLPSDEGEALAQRH